jgi:hypothetical protein
MLKDIVLARPLEKYRLEIGFEDGAEGIVDLASQLSFQGIFEPCGIPTTSVRFAWIRNSAP